jgi:hypothetical protein
MTFVRKCPLSIHDVEFVRNGPLSIYHLEFVRNGPLSIYYLEFVRKGPLSVHNVEFVRNGPWVCLCLLRTGLQYVDVLFDVIVVKCNVSSPKGADEKAVWLHVQVLPEYHYVLWHVKGKPGWTISTVSKSGKMYNLFSNSIERNGIAKTTLSHGIWAKQPSRKDLREREERKIDRKIEI